MILTKSQQHRFWREWAAACRAQGWTAAEGWTGSEIDVERRALLDRAGFESLTQVDRADGFDRVLAELGQLQSDIDRTAETIPGNDAGYRRRLLWLIRKHSKPLGGLPYVLQLARDKFHLTAGLDAIEDLTTEQLNQLMMTLNARRHAKAKSAKNASLTSEEQFPDQVEFTPEADLVTDPF